MTEMETTFLPSCSSSAIVDFISWTTRAAQQSIPSYLDPDHRRFRISAVASLSRRKDAHVRSFLLPSTFSTTRLTPGPTGLPAMSSSSITWRSSGLPQMPWMRTTSDTLEEIDARVSEVGQKDGGRGGHLRA